MANYYPPVSFSFTVSIADDTGPAAAFQEVSGLDAEREVNPLTEGGENRFVHQLPKPARNSNLELKRGIALANASLFKWVKDTLESDLSTPIKPRDLTVALLDAKAKPVMSWHVSRAWPVKWSIGAMDAMKNDVAIEAIELAYDTLTRKVEKPRK